MVGTLYSYVSIREATKKVLLLMAGLLRPNPPPLELNGRWNVRKKKVPKKLFFPKDLFQVKNGSINYIMNINSRWIFADSSTVSVSCME